MWRAFFTVATFIVSERRNPPIMMQLGPLVNSLLAHFPDPETPVDLMIFPYYISSTTTLPVEAELSIKMPSNSEHLTIQCRAYHLGLTQKL